MQKLSLLDKLRSRNVTRWHTVLTAKQQSVAEHSHCMGLIAEAVLECLYKTSVNKPTIEDKYWVLKYSQLHDLPELFTGDLSSPYKSLLKQILPDFESVSQNIEHQLLPELHEAKAYFKQHPEIEMILKAADLLEALNFFKYGKGQDVEHNAVVELKIHEALNSICEQGMISMPQYNWESIHSVLKIITSGESAIINFEHVSLFGVENNASISSI